MCGRLEYLKKIRKDSKQDKKKPKPEPRPKDDE